MADHHSRAKSLAAALGEVPGVRVTRPQTNSFAIYLPGDHEALTAAHLELAKRTGVWLFGLISQTPVPGLAMAEVQVGSATGAISDEEAADLLGELLREADLADPEPS